MRGGPPMPPGGPVYPGPGQPVPAPGYPAPNYPAPNYPTGETTYRAIGTEPFWDLEIGRELIFTDRGNNVSVSDPAPAPINGVAGETYRTQRLEVNIVHRQCSDGMSDRSYPLTAMVEISGEMLMGCAATVSALMSTGESGRVVDGAAAAAPAEPAAPQPVG